MYNVKNCSIIEKSKSSKKFSTQVVQWSVRALEQGKESKPSNDDKEAISRGKWQNQNAALRAQQHGWYYRKTRPTSLRTPPNINYKYSQCCGHA